MKHIAHILFVLVVLTLVCYTQLAHGQNTLASVDQHALSLKRFRSVDPLVGRLIKPGYTDLEKTRAIFRYVSEHISYDTDAIFKNRLVSSDPNDVLRSGKAVCGGYANLFEVIGRRAGLEVITINGYSKGYGYDLDDGLNQKLRHAWNAVKIDGKWHLLDATWGSGYLDGQTKQNVKQFTEHYFLTPPETFVYDHFPDDPRWQLLEKPLSQRQFLELPLTKPPFFVYDLDFLSHRKASVEARETLTIELKAPPETALTAALYQSGKQIKGNYTLVQKANGRAQISALFPKKGEYQLYIFARNKHSRDKMYEGALQYEIQAKSGSRKRFPQTYGTFAESGAIVRRPIINPARNQAVTFELSVPGATQVNVVQGDTWHKLQKTGVDFKGTVNLIPGKIHVVGQFDGSTQHEFLLVYE